MTGTLTPQQIEQLLSQQLIGRIACCDEGIPYILPISYAYDGKSIYCRTQEGKKTDMMRKNNQVCFQADVMHNMANWESVIVWGKYEELTDETERVKGIEILLKRTLPLISSSTTHLGLTWPFVQENLNEAVDGIVFRIVISEKTGRYEESEQSPVVPG
jgi:nitroimidazol reductase NimA-like FMN-containing flavoprotein (pyridoxamine 5'-phosphate oxidase superfamily)